MSKANKYHSALLYHARGWQKQGLLLLIGWSTILLTSCGQSSVNSKKLPASPSPQETRSLTPTPADTDFVVGVVNEVEPAVVQIETAKTVQASVPDEFSSSFFRRFFGDTLPEQPPEQIVRGQGSGFVIDADGLILTNAHVVDQADTVTVSFSNGRTYEGKVLGADPVTDLAVVNVPAQNLPEIPLGDSEQIQTGQWAIAIGNPLGLQKTVTVGVVSAVNRSGSDIGVANQRLGFIQTDAAINPGNSGGPLLNARGQVIGINTAIIGGAQGLGFAIPITAAQRIAQKLIETGKVEHPYLGLQIVSLTPELKQRIRTSNSKIQIEADSGVLVVKVAEESPADKAGLRAGDVLKKIEGQTVTEVDQVQQQVEKSGIGNQLVVEVQRNQQTLKVTVQPAALPPQTE